MRALVAHALDGPDGMRIEERALLEPGPGEVRIRVAAVGLSLVDTLIATGRYQQRPELPWIPGSECAGTVDAIGARISGVAVGDRVSAIAWHGVLATSLCVPASDVARLPDNVDMATGSVIRVAYTTAWHALADRAAIRAGETLLVLGAGGATATAAVEIGVAMGARVIAVASTDARRAAALAAGATHAFASDDFRAGIEAEFGRKAVDVVFDPVGGPASETAFRLLGWRGRHLVIGFASGDVPALPLNLALLAGGSAMGVNVGRFVAEEPEAAAANLRLVMAMAEAGAIAPRIAHRLPLSRWREAYALVGAGGAPGRVVIELEGV